MSDFNKYQTQAYMTAAYVEEAEKAGGNIGMTCIFYAAMGLAGEAGEVANKVKKMLRDDSGIMTPERRDQIAEELGGVLWYAAALCTELDIYLGAVASHNLEILASRKERGAITGDGDQR
jgi:NTP pyrophosphatase (non-canonical NTP hydrolase)